MAIYRYSPESIDALTTKTRRDHTAGFPIFTVAVCAAGLANLPLRAALVCDAVFVLVVGVVMVGSRNKARQRTASLLRSTEIEIDDEKRERGRPQFLARRLILHAALGYGSLGLPHRRAPAAVSARVRIPRFGAGRSESYASVHLLMYRYRHPRQGVAPARLHDLKYPVVQLHVLS